MLKSSSRLPQKSVAAREEKLVCMVLVCFLVALSVSESECVNNVNNPLVFVALSSLLQCASLSFSFSPLAWVVHFFLSCLINANCSSCPLTPLASHFLLPLLFGFIFSFLCNFLDFYQLPLLISAPMWHVQLPTSSPNSTQKIDACSDFGTRFGDLRETKKLQVTSLQKALDVFFEPYVIYLNPISDENVKAQTMFFLHLFPQNASNDIIMH